MRSSSIEPVDQNQVSTGAKAPLLIGAGLSLAVALAGFPWPCEKPPRRAAQDHRLPTVPLGEPGSGQGDRGPALVPALITVAGPEVSEILVEPIDLASELVQPIPTVAELFEELDIEYDEARIELGRTLFESPLLSDDGSLSCQSCHDVAGGRIEASVSPRGIRRELDGVPSAEVLEERFGLHAFWADREDAEALLYAGGQASEELWDLWEGAFDRMGRDDRLLETVASVHSDVQDSGDLEPEDLIDAVEDFTRTLRTPEAPFDRYLRGDDSAVSLAVKQGYQLFKDLGCVECHFGASLGGKAFMKLGAKRTFFGLRPLSVEDLGRFNVTREERDKHVFRVPSLRNVALNSSFLHDGSEETLEGVVRMMAVYQLDVELSDSQVDLLIAFLESLTGEGDG